MRITKILVVTFIALTFIALAVFAEEEKDERIVKSLAFDQVTGTVTYELTYPAKVRIRIGTPEGPLLRTIVDWQERGVGLHKAEWDGFDITRTVKLAGKRSLVFTFNYFTPDDTYLKNVSLEDIMPHSGQAVIGRFLPNLDVNRIHKSHNLVFCREPRLTVKLPKEIKKTKEGYLIIKDKTPFTIDIAAEDKSWFSKERYSIHVFVDQVFRTGELEGYSPYNFVFDPDYTGAGKHLIAVNYSGFSDHIGMITIPVYVAKKGDKLVQTK